MASSALGGPYGGVESAEGADGLEGVLESAVIEVALGVGDGEALALGVGEGAQGGLGGVPLALAQAAHGEGVAEVGPVGVARDGGGKLIGTHADVGQVGDVLRIAEGEVDVEGGLEVAQSLAEDGHVLASAAREVGAGGDDPLIAPSGGVEVARAAVERGEDEAAEGRVGGPPGGRALRELSGAGVVAGKGDAGEGGVDRRAIGGAHRGPLGGASQEEHVARPLVQTRAELQVGGERLRVLGEERVKGGGVARAEATERPIEQATRHVGIVGIDVDGPAQVGVGDEGAILAGADDDGLVRDRLALGRVGGADLDFVGFERAFEIALEGRRRALGCLARPRRNGIAGSS